MTRQRFRQGYAFGDLSARKLDEMSLRVEGLSNMSVVWPLRLARRTGNSFAITLDERFAAPPSEMTVVVRYADTAKNVVRVSPVFYRSHPPKDCPPTPKAGDRPPTPGTGGGTIGGGTTRPEHSPGDTPDLPPQGCGIGIENRYIDMYPDFGLSAQDFAQLVTGDTVDQSTVYVKAYFQSDAWFVKLPSAMATTLLCQLLAPAEGQVNPTNGVARVQFLTYDDQSDDFVPDGDPVDIRVWPRWRDDAYQPFAGAEDIFEAVQFGGQVWLKWKMRMVPIEPPANLSTGDCP